ncbi:ABC transporter substrate-binding protein [Lederbergia galactosidilytica]|uniref:ABC transporter substrate-binding protein n=1 Tax=Lederbergia galactosidilytica TaxID=217031 RepID=A0A177ZH53_9BACI|nr:ABC transporter substrate-binding protein [Lederbergia galactosidilytica]KRG15398.1 ABC transporter substrate-binding protein [Virgibacillus soli]OAK67145.1 ABC transporter substrate-binding protein [Lederbergia galactosidilytica]
MKKITGIISLLTILGLILVGCGNSGKSASSEDHGLKDIEFPLEEKVSLKFMTQSSPLAPDDPNEKLIYKRLEEKTGVHIDWKNYTHDSFIEKRNLALSSGDLPDAILDAGFSNYDLLKYAKDGTIVPVEDLIDQYMPNLQKVLETRPEYRDFITAPDGHIYSFPWIEELGNGIDRIQVIGGLPWINVEWLDNLGLDMPTTTDELKEVLMAFKTQDPNGNGEADEIPMGAIINDGDQDPAILLGSFGLGDTPDHIVVTEDGEVVFTKSQEGYKEQIEYLHDLYNSGLIDEEAFEQDWNAFISKGDQYGLYFTWDKANVSGMNDKFDVLPPLEGPSGEKVIVQQNGGVGFDRGRMVITSSNKNLELTAKWIDQLYEPLQSVQNNWGTYGDTEQQNIFEFDEENNMLKHLPLEGTAPVELREKTNVAGPLAVLDEYYGTITTKPEDAAWRLDLLQKNIVPFIKNENYYPHVYLSLDEIDELSKIEADLFEYVNRKRAEWIRNGKIDEEWDDYLKELDRFNLPTWLQIKQDGYERTVK